MAKPVRDVDAEIGVWPASKHDDENGEVVDEDKRDAFINALEENDAIEEPALELQGRAEELYVDEEWRGPGVTLTAAVPTTHESEMYFSLKFDLSDIEDLHQLHENVGEVLESKGESVAGRMFGGSRIINSDDVIQEDVKTVDGSGRVSIGKEYAGSEKRVVVLEE